MRVNLLGDNKRSYAINWFKIIVIISSILLVLILGSHYFMLINRLNIVKLQSEKYKNQEELLNQKNQEYYSLKRKIEKLQQYENQIRRYQYYWDDIIKELGYLITTETIIENIQLNNNRLIMQGYTDKNKKVIEMISNMKQSPFFTDVNIIKLTQQYGINYELEAVILLR